MERTLVKLPDERGIAPMGLNLEVRERLPANLAQPASDDNFVTVPEHSVPSVAADIFCPDYSAGRWITKDKRRTLFRLPAAFSVICGPECRNSQSPGGVLLTVSVQQAIAASSCGDAAELGWPECRVPARVGTLSAIGESVGAERYR